MNIHNEIKSFLADGFNARKIVISNHVSGFRVTINDWQYGETSFDTGSNLESMIMTCIDRHERFVDIKKVEKAKQLAQRKKELKAELEEVSHALNALSPSN
jgi:hypothetical protein